jgi:ribosomal-protein-alanine N-acetyltransferase
MTPQATLELAQASDARPIALLSRDLIEQGLGWSWTPRRVAAAIAHPSTNVLVARDDERVAGFGIMEYRLTDAHLLLLAVRPERRRSGLGHRLLEWLEAPARVGGLAAIWLEVRASNHGAVAFYERLGYRRLVELPDYYDRREPAIRMGRELTTG